MIQELVYDIRYVSGGGPYLLATLPTVAVLSTLTTAGLYGYFGYAPEIRMSKYMCALLLIGAYGVVPFVQQSVGDQIYEWYNMWQLPGVTVIYNEAHLSLPVWVLSALAGGLWFVLIRRRIRSRPGNS